MVIVFLLLVLLPSDTIDALDFTFMAQLVKSLELALLEFPTVSRPLESYRERFSGWRRKGVSLGP
jgi:hypothetical protein